jgi:hypothetical protein
MADQNPHEAQQPDTADWFLQVLITIVNDPENLALELGITLLAGGFLVSGFLVNGARYFEGFAADFALPFPQGSSEHIRSSFSTYGDIYKGTAEPAPPMYVHLKEARFFSPGGNPIPTNRGVWWRGRVSEVAGFMIGRLGAP